MKKFLTLLLLLPLLAACEKDPDLDKLDYDFVVYTGHSDHANFSDNNTYYVADSVLTINDKDKTEYLPASEGDPIIQAIADNMSKKGFVRVASKENADLGIQASFVKNGYYVSGYPGSNWWWGYPGYWGPGYWGGYWNQWYYPYPVSFGFEVGSLLTEIVDLKGGKKRTDQKLPVLWTGYMTGLLAGSSKVNTQLSVNAINQAFEQSPYISKK